jgi:excisionase family DNA binding protein
LFEVQRPQLIALIEEINKSRPPTSDAPPSPWMTTDQAATHLALSPDALRARARRRTIPAHRDGDRWLYHREEVDAFIRDGGCR